MREDLRLSLCVKVRSKRKYLRLSLCVKGRSKRAAILFSSPGVSSGAEGVVACHCLGRLQELSFCCSREPHRPGGLMTTRLALPISRPMRKLSQYLVILVSLWSCGGVLCWTELWWFCLVHPCSDRTRSFD